MLEAQQASHRGAASVQSRLQVIRRADWRFLLPDPNLNNVLYVGTLPEDLLSALRMLSQSLESASALNATEALRPADVVVLHSPTRAQVRSALGLLQTRGTFYCELHRPLRRPLRFIRAQAGWIHRELTRGGFSSVQTHWHYPSFDACTRLVQIDDPSALAYWLASRNRTWIAQPAPLRLLTASRLLEWLLPCVSIVAQRGEQ